MIFKAIKYVIFKCIDIVLGINDVSVPFKNQSYPIFYDLPENHLISIIKIGTSFDGKRRALPNKIFL